MCRRIIGMTSLVLICFLGLVFLSYLHNPNLIYGLDENIILKDPGSFIDSNGRTNIIGVIDNNGDFPIVPTVAVNVTENNEESTVGLSNSSDAPVVKTITSPTFARAIYPGEGAPFKIILEPDSVNTVSPPFVYSVDQIDKTDYDVLLLNYTNMALGSERALVGTVENMAPFPVYNVSVYASVHDSNQSQLDSAISDNLAVIEPGEKIQFTLTPDPSARSQTVYYSCAGFNLDAPITTLPTSDGGFIPFDLQAVAKLIALKYDDESESVVFGIDHYNPEGGMITLKLPQFYDDQKLSVVMDGLPDDDVEMTSDGKTIKMDIFIPPDEHQVQIQGVSYGEY